MSAPRSSSVPGHFGCRQGPGGLSASVSLPRDCTNISHKSLIKSEQEHPSPLSLTYRTRYCQATRQVNTAGMGSPGPPFGGTDCLKERFPQPSVGLSFTSVHKQLYGAPGVISRASGHCTSCCPRREKVPYLTAPSRFCLRCLRPSQKAIDT